MNDRHLMGLTATVGLIVFLSFMVLLVVGTGCGDDVVYPPVERHTIDTARPTYTEFVHTGLEPNRVIAEWLTEHPGAVIVDIEAPQGFVRRNVAIIYQVPVNFDWWAEELEPEPSWSNTP